LPLDDFPAAYAFGGYQDGTFTLPTGETEETAKNKIINHTLDCGTASIILRGLAGERTVIPWEKAAGLSTFAAARLSEDSWDKAKLKDMAATIQDREERALKSLFHRLGPWLIWFRPDPGTVVANWHLARAFVRSFQSLPDSIRFGFPPYLFSIVTLDPSKLVTPPASAAAIPAPVPEPAPATPPPPVQYADDDQAL
jgi:hypothetical protein